MPIDAISAIGRKIIKQRRFQKIICDIGEETAKWEKADQVLAVANECIKGIFNEAPATLRKGAPDLVSQKKMWAKDIFNATSIHLVNEEGLAVAEKIAAIDPRDANARRLWLACFWLQNKKTISAIKSTQAPLVALHMSCKPRLDRAQASIDSFQSIPSKDLTHVKLIGNGSIYDYQQSSSLLQVPALDTYEHLASKVIDAYTLLAFCPGIKAVIKMDDDHRLLNANQLLRFLRKSARNKRATQSGTFYFTPFPAGHNHGWHHGKCKDPTFGDAAFGFPAPLSWATGEHGYILNRPALLRTIWARLYYRRWLKSVLYEDIALGEISEKLDIKRSPTDLSKAIQFESTY
jgi:hypothetical protein